MKKRQQRNALISLVILGLLLSGCLTGQSSGPTPTPLPSNTPSPTFIPTSTSTVTPVPLPDNIAVMQDSVELATGYLDLLEPLAHLWPANPSISDMEVYPNQPILVIAYGEPSGRLNSAPGGYPQLVFWNIRTNASEGTIQAEVNNVFFSNIAASQDGEQIAFIGRDRFLLATRDPGTSPEALAFTSQEVADEDTRSIGSNNGAAFSPDGRLLAIIKEDGDILLWDVQANEKLAILPMAAMVINDCGFGQQCIAFTPDGESLLAARGNKLQVWNVDDLVVSTTEWLVHEALALAVSPDGGSVILGVTGGGIEVRDLPAGTLHTTLSGHESGVEGLAFSPDGRLLASSAHDGILLWDVRSWTRQTTIDTRVHRLTFNHDGRFLITAAYDERGTLWGMRSGGLAAERVGVKVVTIPGPVYLGSFWGNNVPAAWLTPEGSLSRHEIRLESGRKVIESCAYGGNGLAGTITRRQRYVTASVIDLQTSGVLSTQVFEGGVPDECPDSNAFSPLDLTTSIDGSSPEFAPVLAWIRDTMALLGYK